MSDSADSVAALRDRVEVQEKELEAAVRELGAAARHSVTPASWIRENALLCMTGALALGWWLGSQRRRTGRRHR